MHLELGERGSTWSWRGEKVCQRNRLFHLKFMAVNL